MIDTAVERDWRSRVRMTLAGVLSAALLDFADHHLRGRPVGRSFDQFPPEPGPSGKSPSK